MTIQIEIPPADWSIEVTAYVDRMLQRIQEEIEGSNGVAIRSYIPDKPKEGKIYYLSEGLSEAAIEGYYVWINGEWKRLAYDL